MSVVYCCQFGPNGMFGLKMDLMACADLVVVTTEYSYILLTLYDIINDIKYSKFSALHLSRVTVIFVVSWCQFGPRCIFGLKIGAYGLCRLGWCYNRANLSFPWPYIIVSMIWNTYEMFALQLTRATAFYLLIAANLTQAGFLGWKWSLWPIPDWLKVQRSKAVFFLTLYDIINDMKYFWNVCIAPQPCHSHFSCWLLPIWP